MKVAALAVACSAALTALTASGSAHAEPKGVDWSKVVYDLDQYVRGNTGGTDMLAPAHPRRVTNLAGGSRVPDEDIDARRPEHAWFGVAPRMTLIARDWNGSMRLAGDRLSLVDSMRLSASTRMVVGRARLSSARFAPFLQLGLGQWRVDRTYLPLTPFAEEVATQLGGGFELRLAKRWHTALETDCTSILRQGARIESQQLLSAFFASRIDF